MQTYLILSQCRLSLSLSCHLLPSPPPTVLIIPSIHILLPLSSSCSTTCGGFFLPVKLSSSISPLLITCPTNLICLALIFTSNPRSLPNLTNTSSFDVLSIQFSKAFATATLQMVLSSPFLYSSSRHSGTACAMMVLGSLSTWVRILATV